MKFVNYFSSVTFVMLTADQFVGGDDGSLEQQKRDSYVCRTNRTFPAFSAFSKVENVYLHIWSTISISKQKAK